MHQKVEIVNQKVKTELIRNKTANMFTRNYEQKHGHLQYDLKAVARPSSAR